MDVTLTHNNKKSHHQKLDTIAYPCTRASDPRAAAAAATFDTADIRTLTTTDDDAMETAISDTTPAMQAQAAIEELLTFEFVCKLDDIPEGGRRCALLPSSKRSVMLLRLNGQVYCMDQACYHHGGPLLNGDIEEMGGKVTIKCPWHAFHIAVATGEGLYMGVDMAMDPTTGRLAPSQPHVKSKGVKQRTHFVQVRNDDDVYIADSSLIPGSAIIMSDAYAFHPAKIPPKHQPGDVKIHSRFE